MDSSNNIALVNELLESLIPSENKHSNKTLKRLKKLIITDLFGPSRKTECTKDILTDPISLLKTDILSQALKTTSSEDDYKACVDEMYNKIDHVLPMCDNDTLNNLFIFLHRMFELDRSKQVVRKNELCKIPVNKNNRLYSEVVNYEDIDWNAFYKDLPSISKSCFDYPFYEEPGEGTSFFKEHVAELRTPSSNTDSLFDTNYKIWRFDINAEVEPVVQDEGFVTPGSEFSNESIKDEDSISQCSDRYSDLDIINYDLEVPIKRSWDRLGERDVPKELPFTSETVGTIIHLWKIVNSSQAVGIKSVPIGNQVSFEDLITDLKYLLFGMASPSFYFNQELNTFQICDRLHTETLSPEILAALCEDVINCANYYHSLNLFAKEGLKMKLGCIHQTFCKCIQQILNMYKYSLLNMEWQNIKHLSNFPSLIIPLQRKLTFLMKFCAIQSSPNESKFPSGVQLLDYLSQNLSEVYSSDLSYTLFYMFESCCNAYFRIISEWIFDGCFSTPENYNEFFIEIRREYELCRDSRRVTCIGIRDKKVPNFLRKFYKEIFICGKSINLLKICSSKETLNKLTEKNHPDLVCCFNQKQMTNYEENWREYQTIYEGHFIDRVKIKDKLMKNCGHPNFHNEVRRVREEWFRQQKEINMNEENKNPNVVENQEKFDDYNPEKQPENESNESKTTENEPQLEDPAAITESIEETIPDPTLVESNSVTKTTETDPTNVTITFTPIDQSSHPKTETANSSETPSTPQSKPSITQGGGDWSGNSENKRVKHLVSLLEQKSKPTDENTPGKLPKRIHLGGGDTCSPGPSEVLKDIGNVSQVEFIKNKFKSMNSSINSPSDEKPSKSKLEKGTPLSACQENKLKVMSSEYHNRLNDSFNSPHEMPKSKPAILTVCQENNSPSNEKPSKSKLEKGTPLNACQENRLKVMSSEYHNRLNDSLNSPHEMPKSKPAILTVCEENKLKVMSSEYHVRLNESLDSSQKPKSEPLKPTTLSALQENKLKVMSSEYHGRLSTSSVVEQTPVQSNKPLSACEENKLKVMSSEYHGRLSTSSVVEQTPVQSNKPLSACEENKLKVMSSEYHIRLQNKLESEPNPKPYSHKELTESQKNKLKVMSSEYHHRLSLDPVNTEISSTPKKLSERDLIKQKILQEEYYTESEVKSKSDNISDLSSGAQDELSKITEENESTVETLDESKPTPTLHRLKKHVHFQDIESQPKRQNFFTREIQNFELKSIDDVDIESVADVDITSLIFYLAQSIAVPLKIQMKLVNEAILKVFIEEESYLDHLIALRDYLLLRKPEFTVSLTNSIFKHTEKAKNPYILLNNCTLSSILQRALLTSGTKETITFGRKLSFSIDDEIPEQFTLVDIKELDCLNLIYAIKWPINILITDPIAKKYMKIFKFLFQLQRVLWVLKRDFISMKNLKRGKSIQYMKIQLFRHNMTQIVKILQEYVMREAIETCWNDFVENLTTADIDLDLLYMSHLKYVNKMMQRCFLCDLSSQCRDSILNLFSVILKYHEALKSGVWKRNVEVNFLYHTNFKEIDVIYEDFVKNLNLVRSNLRLLVYGKQKTYFETLYLELSKNAEEVV